MGGTGVMSLEGMEGKSIGGGIWSLGLRRGFGFLWFGGRGSCQVPKRWKWKEGPDVRRMLRKLLAEMAMVDALERGISQLPALRVTMGRLQAILRDGGASPQWGAAVNSRLGEGTNLHRRNEG